METKIYSDSTNYVAQVVKLPKKVAVTGLDNLVAVTHQGNTCLVSKDYPEDELYLFFPSETELSHDFLSKNNLYRHSELNEDKTKKGFFEDNRRCKAIKFKGVISTGFMVPISLLLGCVSDYIVDQEDLDEFKVGDEFNELWGIEICKKYYKQVHNKGTNFGPRSSRVIDQIVDSKFAPEHPDMSHLMKNIFKLNLDDYIAVIYKLHGTSARYFNAPVIRKLTWIEKIAQFFGAEIQQENYDYVTGSRRVLKSVGFEQLPGKNHYYQEDLWSRVGKENFDGKLNEGEAVYCEIIGKTYSKDCVQEGVPGTCIGEDIQHGYSYGFNSPEVFIYRISNINPQGIEVDLSYHQMKQRAEQLGIKVCPELFYGKLINFIEKYSNVVEIRDIEGWLFDSFYNKLLEKPSILDSSVTEEGFVIRKDGYPRSEMWKIKAKSFLLAESNWSDKKEIVNIEDEQSTTEI